MTRRQITRKSFDEEHRRLMLAVKHARGNKREAIRALRDYMASRLKDGR